MIWFTVIAISVGISIQTVCMMKFSALQWGFHQPKFWKAIAEVALYYVLLVIGQFLLKKKQKRIPIFILCVAVVFSYTHQYLLAMAACGVYMLFLYLLGTAVSDGFRLDGLCDSWHSKIVLGISADLVLVAGASALKVGTPEKLRLILPCVLVVLLVLERKRIKLWISKQKNAHTETMRLSKTDIFLLSGIVVFAFVQIGRANISMDYDSTWYGLRSAYMLTPKTGIYDEVPFLACVHTYAKGAEALMLPFAGLSSLCAVYSVNILFGLAIVACAYDTAKGYVGQTVGLFAALCTIAVPGIMNMTVTAKSDILTVFLEIAAVYLLMEGIREKKAEHYITAFGACILSLAFKSSSIIFSSVIVFAIVVAWLCRKPKFEIKKRKSAVYIVWMALGLGVIWLRTWIMSGTPFTFLLPAVIRALGGTIKYPYDFYSVGTSSIISLLNLSFLGKRLLRVFEILFYPVTESAERIIIAWNGPVFAVLLCASVVWLLSHYKQVWGYIKRTEPMGFLCVIFILLLGISFGCVLLLTKPDGNYFGLFYVVTAILAAIAFGPILSKLRQIKVLICLSMVSALLMTIGTSWGWSLGFSDFSLVNKGYYNNEKDTLRYMGSVSLDGIYGQLAQENKPRVEIFSNKMQYVALIPATCDLWVSHRAFGFTTTATEAAYLEYLQFSDMDYLLVEQAYLYEDTSANDMITALAQDGYLQISQANDDWALMKVVEHTDAKEQQKAMRFVQRASARVTRGLYDDNWAAQLLEFSTMSAEERTLQITGYYPMELADQRIDIYIDDQQVDTFLPENDRLFLQLEIAPGKHVVRLVSRSAFKATPPDIREDLAFHLDEYTFE